jgi:putative aminopeptidase FrvX
MNRATRAARRRFAPFIKFGFARPWRRQLTRRMSKKFTAPAFLVDLLNARSPSGDEQEAQAVFDRHIKPHADLYRTDRLGNRIATLNPKGKPVLMLAGHIDEIGLMVTYVNKDGFLYFDTIGGHDRIMIPGRRVVIRTAAGTVKGVTGKRAIQLVRGGVACGVISVPLRYMHTPSEIVDLEDIENTVRLLVEFSKSLKKSDTGEW